MATKINKRRLKALFDRYPADVVEEGLRLYRERQKEEQLSPEAKNRRAKACADFMFFIRTYFGHYTEVEFGPQQLEVIEAVQEYRGKKDRKPLKLMVAMSRGFGKSTILTLMGLLWLIVNGTWKFPIIISSTLESAKGFLQSAIEEVENNEKLTEDFPELNPKIDGKGQTVSWKDSDIVMAGGFRILAKGFLNSIRGKKNRQYRPDALLIDDPDEEIHVASEATMKRKYRWFERAALKLGGGWGLDILFAYTTISQNCVGEYIYNHKDRYKDWKKLKFSALVDAKGDPWMAENGAAFSTWPQWYPVEELLEEMRLDPIGFAQERQNSPLPEADQKFKDQIKTYQFVQRDWTGWRLSLAVDLSLGKTEKSDYSAIVGVGLSPEGKYYEIYSDIQRRRPDAIERDLITALTLFPWNVCGIEDVGGQEYFLLNFRKRVEEYNRTTDRKILCPINGISNTGDKELRIVGGLQPLVAAGLLLLRNDSEILYAQLNEFPYLKKDGPDALEMAVRQLNTYNVVTTSTVAAAAAPVTGRSIHNQRSQAFMQRYLKS